MADEYAIFRILVGLGLVIIVGVLGLIGISIFASGRVEYCYVETNTTGDLPVYKLYGWRDWREDNRIGSYPSLETAVAAARTMECPLTMERR